MDEDKVRFQHSQHVVIQTFPKFDSDSSLLALAFLRSHRNDSWFDLVRV